jgi:tetratricopeptide (TPR) repeat protein
MMLFALALLTFQPDVAMLRRLFEQNLERRHTAQSARDLGQFLMRQNDPEAARAALAEALRLDEQAGAPESLGAAAGDAAGAAAGAAASDAAELALVSPPSEAEPLLRRAAAGTDRKLSARAYAALGHLHDSQNNRAAAAQDYRHALALEESTVTLNALAQDVEPAAGVLLLQRALALDRRTLGPRHPQTATTEANLAGLLLNTNRVEESIKAATEAISIFEESLGPEHPRVAMAATILAYGLRARGDEAGAERQFSRARAINGSR